MTIPRREPAWRVLLRSRWLIAFIVLVVSGGTAAFSVSQPKVYVATATLLVNQPTGGEASFDTVQANQAFARTLATIIGSRNVADAVALSLPFPMSPLDIKADMTFTPVNETQLIEVSAANADPRRAEQLANAYAATFVDYVETTIPDAAPGSGISVADRAVFPRAPDRPKPTLYTLVAFVLSLAAAAGFVLLLSRVDTRFHDSDTLSETFGLPVLGVLPRTDNGEASERLLDESVRLLCTSMAHASTRPLRSIVVTSSRAGEGKSTVAGELATALATLSLVDGAVLAVDADLRRPTLPCRVGLSEQVAAHSRKGLTNYLNQQASLSEVTLEVALPSLKVIPAGPLPTHPSALLGFPTSRKALADLVQAAETVVIDTPPLTVGADAALCAMDADAVLLVVDLAQTREPELRAALDQLHAVGARPLGFVVNRSPMRNRASAYYAYTQPEPIRSRRFSLRRREPAQQTAA